LLGQVSNSIHLAIQRVQAITNLSNDLMAEVLNISTFDYELNLKNKKDFSLFSIILFCKHFNLSLERLFQSGYSLNELKLILNQGGLDLPERYKDQAQSYRVAAKYMLDYISSQYGEDSLHLIMKKLGLSDHHFQDLTGKNNVLLTLDLCHELFSRTDRTEIFNMGAHFFETCKDSKTFSALKFSKNQTEVFEKMIYDIAPFALEKNYDWSISNKQGDRIIIEGTPNSDVYHHFDFSQTQLENIQSLREGLISSLPRFVGKRAGKVTSLKSVLRGDLSDQFEVVFEQSTYH
jgi:hypothetical protein